MLTSTHVVPRLPSLFFTHHRIPPHAAALFLAPSAQSTPPCFAKISTAAKIAISPTNCLPKTIRKAMDDTAEFDDDFSRYPWISALQFLGGEQNVSTATRLFSICLLFGRDENELPTQFQQQVAHQFQLLKYMVASIIYLNSPVGVGFSYSENMSYYVNGDLQTAETHLFLLKWLEKFPEFTANPFYIAGESYAGIYVPTLAPLVVDGINNGTKPEINFKGYMIGNRVCDPHFDGNTLVPFAHGMGPSEFIVAGSESGSSSLEESESESESDRDRRRKKRRRNT